MEANNVYSQLNLPNKVSAYYIVNVMVNTVPGRISHIYFTYWRAGYVRNECIYEYLVQ